MFSRKRKDGCAAAAEEQEPDDVNKPIRALLGLILTWRDACDRAYRVVHKLELSPSRALLRVGKFDRVTAGSLRALERILGPDEAYTLGGCDFVLRDRALAITLVKRASASDAAAKRMRRAAAEAAAAAPPQAGRALVAQALPSQDRPFVEEAVHRVQGALGGCSESWQLLELPAEYQLRFKPGANSVVPDRALLACSSDASYVDFEEGLLVAVVSKQAPDILVI